MVAGRSGSGRIRVAMLTVFCVAVGCGGPWEAVSFTDEGELCFEQRGASVIVFVTAPDCLSSGCSRDLDGSCSVSVDGTTIRLTSEISWEDKHGVLADCKTDCGSPTIECSLGELADGSYVVVHGGEEVPLVVPVDSSCGL